MSLDPIVNWHQLVKEQNAAGIDFILAEEVIFYSPVIHTPQIGKTIAAKYLKAAFQVFFNESFRYVHEFRNSGSTVLEFELELDGININGVDMIEWNEEGKITKFKVMIRPLKAINLIHQKMAARLQAHR